MRLSFTLLLLAGAAALGVAVMHLITVEAIDPAVGPRIYWFSTIGGAALLTLALVLAALRGTDGSRRGRLAATCLLALTPGLLVLGPAMLVTVVPALAALILLWVPASGTYVRRASAQSSTDAQDSELAALMDSDSSGPRVPWANAMPGNPHQPGI